MRAQRWTWQVRGRIDARRLAHAAAVVAFAGLVALPFAASVGEPSEVVAGGPVPTTTSTTAPAPLPVPAAPTTAPPPAPPPPVDPAPVAPPPIVVEDPAAGVGAAVAAEGPAAPTAGPPAPVPVPGPPAAPPAGPVGADVGAAAPGVPVGALETHPERLWVVSIGIDDYPGERYDLRAAAADAITVTDAMAGLGVPADHLYELRDGAATVEGVLAAVDWLVANAGPADTVVFFYAGHVRSLGGGTEVLVTADGRWIADWYLASRFAGLRADDAWFAIAACYGGGFDELLAPGRILTAAADPDELAYESLTYGRSYMVEFVFQRAVARREAPAPTVQSVVAWAETQLVALHPEHTLWHVDDAGRIVSLDGADRNLPPPLGPGSGGEPAPPTTAPPPPPRERCVLGLLCG